MKVSERLALIDTISRELQKRYTFSEINTYFRQFKIHTPNGWGDFNSKRVYAKECLSDASLDAIGAIANDLEIGSTAQLAAQANPPAIWKASTDFRLFISHLSNDKDKAMRLRDCLKMWDIAAFVAHEDIEPTLEWQNEIERALFAMDAMVAIHTVGFSASYWTQQEVGFALGRGIKVISFKMGEDPKGFISKHQALSRKGKAAEEIAKEINKLLEADDRTKAKLDKAQIPF